MGVLIFRLTFKGSWDRVRAGCHAQVDGAERGDGCHSESRSPSRRVLGRAQRAPHYGLLRAQLRAFLSLPLSSLPLSPSLPFTDALRVGILRSTKSATSPRSRRSTRLARWCLRRSRSSRTRRSRPWRTRAGWGSTSELGDGAWELKESRTEENILLSDFILARFLGFRSGCARVAVSGAARTRREDGLLGGGGGGSSTNFDSSQLCARHVA